MNDETTAVNPADSANADQQQQVVNDPATTTTQEQTQAPDTTAPASAEPNPQYETVDETGVPWKNRALEWRRKHEEAIEQLPQLVEKAVKDGMGSNTQQREYTIAELEAYAIQNPQHRPWVEEEKAKLIRKSLASEMDEKLQSDRKRQQADIQKQQSLKYVMETYPETFLRNQQGQIVGWNNAHPLCQQIGVLMQDKRFADDPEGLTAAADIAYARYARSQQPNQLKKDQQLKAENKALQPQTLVEGGGKQNVPVAPEHRVLIDKAKQTGSMRDAAAAISAMAKARRAAMEQR